jgi:anaerobic magnesium-protoporphyrin IX monomethyl ester cyclase
VEQIYASTRILRKHNIHPSFFIQFGYPGETKDDIRKTIDMINELLPFEIGISVSYPLPGTLFYERVKTQLQDKANWTDSDELALMFRNTYAPAFYKQLHRYVHKSYRQHVAIDTLKKLWAKPFSLRFGKMKKALSFLYYLPAAWLAKRKLRQYEMPVQ